MVIGDLVTRFKADTSSMEKAKSRIAGTTKKMGFLNAKTLGAAGAVGGLAVAYKKMGDAAYSVIKGSIKLQAKEAKAFAGLQSAVDMTTASYSENEEALKKLFAQQQKYTEYGDDQSADMLGQLIEMTGDYEKSVKNMTLMQDLASTEFLNNQMAAKGLSRVMEGDTQLLQRYVPQLKGLKEQLGDTATDADVAAEALSILRERFGGLANRKLLADPNRQMKQLQNTIGDIKELIGKGFFENFDGITKLTAQLQKFAKQFEDDFKRIGQISANVVNNIVSYFIKGMGEPNSPMVQAVQYFADWMKGVAKIAEWIQGVIFPSAASQVQKNMKDVRKEIERNNQALEALQKVEETRARIGMSLSEKQIEKRKKLNAENQVHIKQLNAMQKEYVKLANSDNNIDLTAPEERDISGFGFSFSTKEAEKTKKQIEGQKKQVEAYSQGIKPELKGVADSYRDIAAVNEEAQQKFQKYLANTDKIKKFRSELQQVADSISDTLVEATETGKLAIDDLYSSIKKMLVDDYIRSFVNKSFGLQGSQPAQQQASNVNVTQNFGAGGANMSERNTSLFGSMAQMGIGNALRGI